MERIDKALSDLATAIAKAKQADIRDLYQPELSDVDNFLSKSIGAVDDDGRTFFKDIYCRSRQDGNDIDKSLGMAQVIYKRDFEPSDRFSIIKSIESIVKTVLEMKATRVHKSKEGDTKMIFGRPAEFKCGKWTITGGKK